MQLKLSKQFKSLIKSPLTALLAFRVVRHRAIFEVIANYYIDLNIVVPLPNGIKCPITLQEHWVSFDNLFCDREYDEFLRQFPYPKKWLDLGCHAGHFTLLLASLWADREPTLEWEALLIDADSRVESSILQMIRCNKFGSKQIQFIQGAISETCGAVAFAENSYMTSEKFNNSALKSIRMVNSVNEREIMARMPGPYDLVKMDIEGAEYDFLKSYAKILSKTKHLLFEWHSWHGGGGGRDQLVSLAAEQGFQLLLEQHADREVRRNGRMERCGVILMKNTRLSEDL